MMSNGQTLDQETLRHRIADLATEALPHIRMGYHLLAQQESEQRQGFVEYVLDATAGARRLDRDKAVGLIGLNTKVIGDVLSAVGISIGAVIDLEVSEQDFVNIGSGIIFDREDEKTAQEVIRVVLARKSDLRSGMNSASLANAVLPSFRAWSSEVDLRLSFEEGDRISGGVPVSVNYIGTDTDSQVWFQASLEDLEAISSEIGKTIAQMRKAQDISKSFVQ